MNMMPINRGYKAKTIERRLRAKIDAWADTLPFGTDGTDPTPSFTPSGTDLTLPFTRKQFLDAIVVTGGAIASMLIGEEPNDYDVYLKDRTIATGLLEYYLNVCGASADTTICQTETGIEAMTQSSGVAGPDIDERSYQYFEYRDPQLVDRGVDAMFMTQSASNTACKNYEPMMITSNAISLGRDIQVITRFCGTPEEVHQNFDFIHTHNYYTVEGGLVTKKEALESLLSKTLIYSGSRFPVCSLFRTRKFIRRGWTISAGEMFKIIFDAASLDLSDRAVLRDQLIGVDVAYFREVLDLLDKGGAVDRTYLFQLLDKAFNDANDDEPQTP